ncbi:MAG TPA: DUF4382 domain-containing protein [Bacteroidia bacterium]|jgi:hypothetical protein|nr:DUF4382 domain-containing protein [Bacteroidia bacterium]
MSKRKIYFVLSLLVMVVLVACRKDSMPDGTLRMRMLDAPAATYEQVNIDLKSVQVFVAGRTNDMSGDGWVTLNAKAGLYDLTTLVNGVDQLLVDEQLPAGYITQIRLGLGEKNSVMANGQLYPLTVPSGSESGLKLNVNETIVAGNVTEVFLDFDAQQSVVDEGNGTYSLKPVIRTFTMSATGSVSGITSTTGPGVTATLDNGGEVRATPVDAATGYFLIRGVPSGTYTLRVYAPGIVRVIVIPDVVVKVGVVTDVGVVNMPH